MKAASGWQRAALDFELGDNTYKKRQNSNTAAYTPHPCVSEAGTEIIWTYYKLDYSCLCIWLVWYTTIHKKKSNKN